MILGQAMIPDRLNVLSEVAKSAPFATSQAAVEDARVGEYSAFVDGQRLVQQGHGLRLVCDLHVAVQSLETRGGRGDGDWGGGAGS